MRMLVVAIVGAASLAGAGLAEAGAKPGALIKQWTDLNSRCRGGSGDDPKTMQACEQRDAVGKRIDAAGWCYGKDGQMAYQYQWHACAKGSLHYS